MTKLIVIVGITGNQGGSVAETFHGKSEWRIRGLTRDLESSTSKGLAAKGIEMVQCSLHDPETLHDVFKGANLVFSVTDFWAPFFDPANHERAQKEGKSIGQLGYELEYEQGKNIVDAVARHVEELDEVGLVGSTLCDARKIGGEEYSELWHFYGKSEIFPDYVEKTYPSLAKKTSYLHTGYFYTSWNFIPDRWFAKLEDGSIQMQTPTSPETVIPHLEPAKDTGPFLDALLKLPPKSVLMAANEWLTWPEWIQIWGEETGMQTSYKQVSVQNFEEYLPGATGKEIGEMFEFTSKLAKVADWGIPSPLKEHDLQNMGITVHKQLSLREYIRSVDWVAAGIIKSRD